jgi:hypothetical protein
MAVTLTFPDGSTLELDATLRQSHERRNEVTKHPVEKGADVTDNIRPLPRTVALEAVIAARPVVNPGTSPEPNRHIAAFEKIEKAAMSGTLLKVTTGLTVYENMAIEGFSAPREPRTGVDLYFTLTLCEVVFATAATTKIPKDALGAGKIATQASSAKPRGVRQATAPTAPQAARTGHTRSAAAPKTKMAPQRVSLLKQGISFIFGQ